MLFVPVFGIAFDLAGKVFSNMFYPTQTQIHVEIESREIAKSKRRPNDDRTSVRTNGVSLQNV